MRVTVELTPEEEARLAAKARAEGVSIDALVGALIKDVAVHEPIPPEAVEASTLPKWRGQVIGRLRRQDIYEDA